MSDLWRELDPMDTPEEVRLELFDQAARGLQLHIADLLRVTPPTMMLKEMVESLAPGLEKLSANVDDLLRQEARNQASGQRERLIELGAPERSEEHTSELQSLMRISYAVFCLKKKNKKPSETNHIK